MRIGLELVNHDRVILWRPIDRPLMSVGSNPECDLCIPDPAVAPVQSLLRIDDGVLRLINRAPDGTHIGDECVSGEVRLADGDQIRLGAMVARVCYRPADVTRHSGPTQTLAAATGADGQRYAVSIPEKFPSRRWEIGPLGLRVGADPTNHIVLDDPFVSSFHAQIHVHDGRCLVRDMGSRNGIFVGDQKIIEGEIPPGVPVRFGRTRLVVHRDTGNGASASEPGADDVTTARLVGSSAALEKIRLLIDRVAAADAPVLLTGETGTGKDVAARLIAQLGARADQEFVAINCGALSPLLVESELFGHERGAFTGAVAKKIGAFEAADHGTLFLDEIGELPLELQPKLLRVLEAGEVRRVGASDVVHVDVRVIAATNRHLEREVEAGRFRQDLLHRLHVLAVEMPPLRERPEDMIELARFFVGAFSPPEELLTLTPAALDKLRSHHWPGNARELKNVLQRACLLRQKENIDAGDISFVASTLASRVQAQSAVSAKTLYEIEREAICTELARHKGNKKEAAASLGVSRSTIHRKIEEFAIDLEALLRGA